MRAHALALSFLVCGSYAASLDAPFVFDDVPSIVQNPHIETLDPRVALRSPAHVESSFAGRPVASYTLAISHAIGGRSPAGFHAVQIAIHAANVCLFLWILRRTFTHATLGELAPRVALAAAALWAVHPLATEAVVYASARSELLVAGFTLAALAAAIRVFAGEGRRGGWTAAAAAFALLAVFSKENAASLPLVVLLYDRTFVSDGFADALRRHRPLHAALFASWLPLAALVASAPRGKTVGLDLGLGSLEYLYTQAGVLIHYATLAAWPHPLRFLYDWEPVRSLDAALPELAIVAGLGVATFLGVLLRPRAAFAPACCFLLLAPTSSVVPIVSEIAAEKRMYLPLASVAAAACAAAWLAIRAIGARLPIHARALAVGASLAAAAVVSVALTATVARVDVYRSDLDLWVDTVGRSPNHPWAHNNLGIAWRRRGELALAERHFARALEIRPSLAPAWVNLGNVRSARGDAAGAIAAYREAAARMPEALEVQYNLGLALARAGRVSEALPHFEAAVRIHPHDRNARVALARTYRRLADPVRAARDHEAGARVER